MFLRVITLEYDPSRANDLQMYCRFSYETDPWTMDSARYLPAHDTTDNTAAASGGRLLSCKVPAWAQGSSGTERPCSVRLAPTKPLRLTTADFKIIDTAPLTSRRDFTVCVPPLYGDIPQAHVMEFMELTSLLGADHVTFYDYDMSAQALRLVRYYARINRATLLTWKPKLDVNESIWNIGVKAAMTD